MAKPKVLTLIDTLSAAGAERVAVNLAIATSQSDEFLPLVCASRRGGDLEPLLRQNGVEYRVLGRRGFWDVGPFVGLVRWIRKEQISLIHSHMKGSNLWASLIGRVTGIPVIAHAHGQPTSASDSAINAVVAQLAGRIIAVSERERENLTQSPLVRKQRVVTIRNGLDAGLYALPAEPALRRELGIKEDAFVVGICAQLRVEKQHETFLRAAQLIAARTERAHFLIVGDGARRAELEALAEELGLSERCSFAGHRNDVPKLLKIFDVGVLTSKREGLPLVILEYMTSGLPVVATAVGGIPEAIREGENGFLIPVADVEGLAERIQALLESPELCASLARRGREIFAREFSQDAMLSKVFALYREVLPK